MAYAFVVVLLGATLPTPLYTIYQEEFGFSELMVTVIFATYATGVIAALLLFGRLSDQIGRRRVLLPGLALSALSAVVFLLAQGVGELLAGRVLSGLAAGVFTGTAPRRSWISLRRTVAARRRSLPPWSTWAAWRAGPCSLGCWPSSPARR